MNQRKNIMSIFLEGTAGLYVLVMLVFFPLFYQDNYIDISSAKLSFFTICTVGMAAAMLLFAGMGKLQQYKEKMLQTEARQTNGQWDDDHTNATRRLSLRQWLSKVSITTWFLLIFAAGVCMATIFSINPLESLYAKSGRKLGLLVFLLCIAMYVMVGTYFRPGKWVIWFFWGANTIVFLLNVLNYWGLDPLGMYKNLQALQHQSFTSTIGNINAYVGYLCMVIPAAMVLYILEEKRVVRMVAGAFLVLGFCTCYCSCSESWFLGIGLVFLILLWFAMGNSLRMRRFLEVCCFFWLGSLLMKGFLLVGEAVGFWSSMTLYFKQQRLLHDVLLQGYTLTMMGILVIGALCYTRYREKRNKNFSYRKLRTWLFLGLGCLFGSACLLVVVANLKPGTWEGIFAVLNSLKIQDRFGSGRGYIWRTTIEGWLDLPLWDKITGYGLNCYYSFIQKYDAAGATEMFVGMKLVDAHNEFLQFLVTTGVFGVVGYFGLLISTVVSSAKKYLEKPIMLLGIVVPCGYMAQGLVNNPTVFLTPYLFLMLGIIKSLEKIEDV